MLRKGPGRPRKVVHELISKQRPLKDTFNKLRKAPKAVRNAQANSAYPTGHLAAIQNTPASNGKKAKHGDAQQTFLVNQLALQYGKLGVRTKNELRNSGAFRVQVVDRGLCDDVLQQLEQSLRCHRGCDIIDINPGASIWSSLVHDAVKPRSHIFLEPEFATYMPFIKPLLEKPGSKYKHVPWSGVQEETYDRIVSEGVLPQQKLLQPSDPTINELNESLLVLAQFTRAHASSGLQPKATRENDKYALHNVVSCITRHPIIQRYGLVRFLVWTGSTDIEGILPKSIYKRSRQSVEAEMGCASITEVAGGIHNPFRQRDPHIAIESAKQVAFREKEGNIRMPDDRKLKSPADIDPSVVQGPWIPPALSEYQRLESAYKSGEFVREVSKETRDRNRSNGSPGPRVTPEFTRLRSLRSYKDRWDREQELLRALRVDDDALSILEIEISNIEDDTSSSWIDLKARIEEKRSNILERVSNLKINLRNKFFLDSDDQRALRQHPPLMMWDRRPFEPIIVRDHEFYPPKGLRLLDIQPKALTSDIETSAEARQILRYIISLIFIQKSENVSEALERIAPGASSLIREVPEMSDPLRGGRFNIEDLKVRSLSPAMLEGIVRAWQRWPLRPSESELSAKTQKSGGFVAEDKLDDRKERLR